MEVAAMTESALVELIAQGGIGTVLVLVLFVGGRWFGREMVNSQKELTAEIKHQGEQSQQRHVETLGAFSTLAERITRIEARADERDGFDEDTPVRGMRAVRNGAGKQRQ
jgi:hypothetical protein